MARMGRKIILREFEKMNGGFSDPPFLNGIGSIMHKNIDRLLTPGIRSTGVGYDELTKLDGNITVLDSCGCNRVSIEKGHATVRGTNGQSTAQGLAYLRQLETLFDGQVPVCEFEFHDPAFSYRGFMIDVCRHFMPVCELKRIIDVMSMIGFNYFHWHLTEDQGWRFTVDGYPRLEEISSTRADREYVNYDRQHGGIYTDDDLKDIVSFCAERNVTVIPEIEIPGHATALLAAYPEFGCTGRKLEVETRWGIFNDVLNPASPQLWEFLDKAIGKLASVFPGPYIHIGGDECPHVQWKENEACLALMAENGLKDTFELQGWFTSKAAELVASHGKRAMGWDEVVEAPAIDKSVIVMSWRGLEGARTASSRGHEVILCPQQGLYFDKGYVKEPYEPAQWGTFTVRDTYNVDISMQDMAPEQRKLVLGGQCNVWTEQIHNGREMEYMMFPRAFALADSLWLGSAKNWERMLDRRDAVRELCWKLNLVCSPVRWEE